jgi:DNA-binding NtrC family response regulator
MKAPARPLNVLVVDDEEGFRDLLKWELTSIGMNVQTAASGDEGVTRLGEQTFDVVITDITMPKMDGLKLLNHVKSTSPKTEVIVVTGFSAVETAVYAMRQGAFDFVLKPYDMDDLMSRVKKAAEAYSISNCKSCGRMNHE